MNAAFPVGEEGKRILERIAKRIRTSGKAGIMIVLLVSAADGTPPTACITPRMGGLRPLAVHFDNGWDSDVAKNNGAACDTLNVDLHTVIMDLPESRALTNANIRACVPILMCDDVGIAFALYRSAVGKSALYYIKPFLS